MSAVKTTGPELVQEPHKDFEITPSVLVEEDGPFWRTYKVMYGKDVLGVLYVKKYENVRFISKSLRFEITEFLTEEEN